VEASRRMQRVQRRDTRPERLVRTLLHAKGLRYFVDRAPVARSGRRADILFPRLRIAVYIDGCFWHTCPLHGTTPKSNTAWWIAKLATNRKRDRENDELLATEGWAVLRYWEHEDPITVADKIEAVVASTRSKRSE
jgi:DNA mismatch endonuclease, patch repair protein